MGKESAACRVCLKKSKDSIELEAIFMRKPRITYLEGYNICTQLHAMIDDELPKNICPHCKDELKAAFRFMEKAKESDKKLREKLGDHRITRSSRRIEQGQNSSRAVPQQDETIFEEIKTEFISCSKDPLEDSDIEEDEKSEDEIEMNWTPDNGDNEMETDGFADEKASPEDDEDDDDKPLKELIKKVEKLKPIIEEPSKTLVDFDSTDVFNDFPEPDNYSSDEEGALKNKIVAHVPNPPTTSEAQIFPQGRYLCKICQKTYFTAAGLKAHIAVHMPKKKKVKRVRGPNKKKGKNKKKSSIDDDDDEGEEEPKDEEGGSESKKEQLDAIEEKDESLVTNDATACEATATDGKRKRKGKTPKPKKMFPCHVCGKHMISASKLRYHMVMHTGEKDYLCTMCPKAYSTIYALKHHMRTHTGERPYECKFCGDKFTRPTTLKSHMRRHTGERPYGCDICGKRFIQHSSMTTHMKLNHMAKTIACPHCDKKYARQTDLNTHLLSHTGDKPFSCELCPSRFIRQANLNKHMNQHHSAKSNAATATKAAKPPETVIAKAIPAEQSMQQTTMPQGTTPTGQVPPLIQRQNQNLPTVPLGITITATNTNTAVQSMPQQAPLPRVISVRSLANLGSVATVSDRMQMISTPPGSLGNDESNGSNHSNVALFPPAPPSSQQQQQTHLQQSHMGPPHVANNENSIPMSMNIERIPGGIPAHNMLSVIAPAGGAQGHITAHNRLESVEHLKGINPPVDNLPIFLGQVMDPERVGRSVDEIMRWSWPNAS